MENLKMGKKRKEFLVKLISVLVLAAGALVVLVPFIWMFSTSFKTLSDVFQYPPKFFGEIFYWQNYVNVFETIDFIGMFKNTLIVTVAVAAGQLVTSTMAGFAFTYLNFRGRDTIFKIFLFAVMVPFYVMLIPTFSLMRDLKLTNTLWSLILPSVVSPFGIFMMRQSYLSIPRSLGEAAAIDGCSPWKIFTRIYLPLSKPAMTTLVIFTFMSTWNDFIRPLIFLTSNKNMTLTLGLYNLVGSYATDWGLLMAAVIMSLLPILILYLCLQDFFVEGIAVTGLKG